MMRAILFTILIVFCITSSGCMDQLDIEEETLTLLLAFGMNDEQKLTVLQTNPIFDKEIKSKTQALMVKSDSIRDSKIKLNTFTNGKIVGGKIQVVVMEKDVVMRQNPLPLMDVLYRDPKNSLNAAVIVLDSSIENLKDIVNRPDRPRISVYLKELVETNQETNRTVETTLRSFYYQMLEKGKTPSLTEVKIVRDDMIGIAGIALLNESGIYKTKLSENESVYLLLLQDEAMLPAPISIPIPMKLPESNAGKDKLSFDIMKIKHTIKPEYYSGRFHFTIQLDMTISLTEKMFLLNVQSQLPALEKIIAQKIKNDIERVVQKIQKHRIDPIGLGIYARAYSYPQWKEVKDNWGEELARADIEIETKVKVRSFGVIK